MQRIVSLFFFLLMISAAIACQNSQPKQTINSSAAVSSFNPEGAWRMADQSGNERVMIVQDGFITVASFNKESKKFEGTVGGTYQTTGNILNFTYEFNTFDKSKVGTNAQLQVSEQNGNWQLTGDGQLSGNWKRINEQNSTSPLAGTWRITGRERNGQMQTIQPTARKTYKVLSGNRFQWIAFNSETGEFSGTGGGTYTADNGKYTESIEFFSRDSSRVGMQLSFNCDVKDGKWHHTGQSSTGNPVNEIWERIKE